MKLTVELLKNSSEFKEWVKGKVVLIHDLYRDDFGSAFLCISMDMGKVTLTRFWASPNRKDQLDKIHCSIDYKDVSVEETFALLFEQYSMPLK